MADSARHKLVDDTLVRENDGIVARCICGWRSEPHISSLLASDAMQDHEDAARSQEKR